MLIKVTNYCSMGCSHCMEDSTVKGEHMSADTFRRALQLTERVEAGAYQIGVPRFALLSGGECTEHPEIVGFVETALAAGFMVTLITNGLWLGNDELRENLLRPEWGPGRLFVQVTNDPRFYPTAPPLVKDERISYVDKLSGLLKLGRAARSSKVFQHGVPAKRAPSSFNIRSLTRSFGSIERAITVLRANALAGKSGWCSPSISANGDVVAGESNQCFRIGTVDSSNHELTAALINMQCNRCGHVDGLTQLEKRAIGESTLYAGTE